MSSVNTFALRKVVKAFVAFGLYSSLPLHVNAQEINKNSANQGDEIETIVVTAAGREQLLSKAAASISVLDRSDIEKGFYKDLTDALSSIPGGTVTRGGSRRDISIRGMSAQYTALLVDGKKQSGRETQPSSSGGFEQDWLPPLEAIERIEVVRGPMATLYGSDAIGGVINIITRKDYQEWQGNIRLETTIQENSDSGTHTQGQIYLAGPIVENLLSMSLSGLYQEREEDEIERGYGGKELENYRAELHLTPTENDRLSFEYSKQDQIRTSTPGKSLPESSRDSETNNNRSAIALTHDGDYQWGSVSSYIQKETVENEGREITVENTRFNTQWAIPLEQNHVVLGAAYVKEDLEDFSNAADASTIKNDQWSLFADNEWQATDKLSITYGARVDDNEVFDTHISPRIYAVYNLEDSWIIKSGISTGYSAPSLREMSANWVQESRGGDIYGNPELAPETSVNTEIGVYYNGSNSLTSSATVFYHDFEDKINLVNCPEITCGVDDARYNINVDKAVTYGAELQASMDFTESVSFNGSYTYTESEQKSGDNEGLPLTQVPKHLIAINGNWEVSETINSWVRATYRGKDSQPIAHSSRSVQAPSISFVDLGGNWQITPQITLSLAVYNLLDEETSYDEYGYVEDGRRFWLAVDTKF